MVLYPLYPTDELVPGGMASGPVPGTGGRRVVSCPAPRSADIAIVEAADRRMCGLLPLLSSDTTTPA